MIRAILDVLSGLTGPFRRTGPPGPTGPGAPFAPFGPTEREIERWGGPTPMGVWRLAGTAAISNPLLADGRELWIFM